MDARELRVTEIFRSVQGEGTLAGLPCAFVRLAGCPLRCRWCDTAYAFSGGERMSVEEAARRATALGTRLVEVTGGEPLAQPACVPLLRALLAAGHEVLLETSGALDISAVPEEVRVVMDLKPPGSGEAGRNRWENLALLRPHHEVKFVLADRADYEWARDVVRRHRLDERCAVLLSPAWGLLDPAELAAWMLEDGLRARLQLQLHKLIWGPDARGV